VKLTVNAIKSLNPAIKEVEHMDADYPGFGVRVNPGGTKTFIYRYRINGKLRRISLGRFEQARSTEVTHGQAMAAGLCRQHTSQVGFSTARGACDQHIVMLVDPVTAEQVTR